MYLMPETALVLRTDYSKENSNEGIRTDGKRPLSAVFPPVMFALNVR